VPTFDFGGRLTIEENVFAARRSGSPLPIQAVFTSATKVTVQKILLN
jgi:hypothetical protein